MQNDIKLSNEKMLSIKLPEICIHEKDAKDYVQLVNEFIHVLKEKIIDDYFSGKAIYKHDYSYNNDTRFEIMGQAIGFRQIDQLCEVETEIFDSYVDGCGVDVYSYLQQAKELINKNLQETTKEGKSSGKKKI